MSSPGAGIQAGTAIGDMIDNHEDAQGEVNILVTRIVSDASAPRTSIPIAMLVHLIPHSEVWIQTSE